MKHLFACLFLLLPLLAVGQNDDYYSRPTQPTPARRTYTITLRDGTELRGELIRQDSTEALIRTRNLGEIRVRSEQILRIEQDGVRGDRESEAGYPNLFPQTMRLAPTAHQAEKGRVYFRNYVLYISQFEYGVTDNWSIGTSFFSFAPTNLFSLNTKFSTPVGDRVRIGLQAQFMAIRLFSDVESIGYVQGLVTTGDRQRNSTFGLGWSISNGQFSRNVVATFGLVRKVSPKLSFITENFALFGSGVGRSVDFAGLLSAGIRFDRRRHAFDVAAYLPLIFEQNTNPVVSFLPLGSYHLRIGR